MQDQSREKLARYLYSIWMEGTDSSVSWELGADFRREYFYEKADAVVKVFQIPAAASTVPDVPREESQDLICEMAKYLSQNKYTKICSGSMFHIQLSALADQILGSREKLVKELGSK